MEKPPSSDQSLKPELGQDLDQAEIGAAVGAIGGIGATAMSHEVEQPSGISNEGGFLRRAASRIANSYKQAWENDPAISAVHDAGEKFSKWEIAKIVSHKVFIDSSKIIAKSMLVPFSERMDKSAQNTAQRMDSGVSSRTLRKKMANVLVESHNQRNPVQTHLSQYDREIRGEVDRSANKIRFDNANPELAMIGKTLKGFAAGVAVPTAAYLVAKGHLPPGAIEQTQETINQK